MWMDKKWFEAFTTRLIDERNEWAHQYHDARETHQQELHFIDALRTEIQGENKRLEIENTRLRAEISRMQGISSGGRDVD